jgi:hypothetical protein
MKSHRHGAFDGAKTACCMARGNHQDTIMAACKLPPPDPAPRALPLPPEARQAVVAASRLLERAQVEHDAAVDALRTAEAAVAAAAAVAAEAALAAIEAGEASPGPHPESQAAIRRAAHRVAQSAAARDLAALRYREALDKARAAFAGELRERVAELVAEAAVAAQAACDRNDQARQLLAYGADHGAPGLPPAYAGVLRLPSLSQLGTQLTEARRSLSPPARAATPPGKVAIRWVVAVPPYLAGENVGLDEAEAILQIRAGNAELVDKAQAKRLGLDKLVKFDRPTKIKFSRDFTPRTGSMIPAGTVAVLDPVTAGRVVNLDFGRVIDD